jgi:hypothetical protein
VLLATEAIGITKRGPVPEAVGSSWNLRADHLEQQSEETINFLYELLE